VNGEYEKYKMIASCYKARVCLFLRLRSRYLRPYSFKKMSKVPEAIRSSSGKLQNDYNLPAEER
jgi:hypothetical protein